MAKLLTLDKVKKYFLLVIFIVVASSCMYYMYIKHYQLHIVIPDFVYMKHAHCLHASGSELNQSKETMKHDTLAPLDDFSAFPCLKGALLFPKQTWRTQGKCVRTICETDRRPRSTEGCVPLKTLSGATPICTYPADVDNYVSVSLQTINQWEGPMVDKLTSFVRARPGLIFLDLGCNIGTYTLSMAHNGVKVFAVDPIIENLKLVSLSLNLGNLQDNVTLIWNGVSDEHKFVKLKKQQGNENVGGTEIASANLSRELEARDYLASTITLDDLVELFRDKQVGIKMDIENSEYPALMGGNSFFDKVDVVVFQIEWYYHKTQPDGIKMKEFLFAKGFDVFADLDKQVPLKSMHVSTWPNDVYFMK